MGAQPSTVSSAVAPPVEHIGADRLDSLCSDRQRWIALTKSLGVFGAVLLVLSTPLASCRANGCAGPRENQRLRWAWLIYFLCALMFVVCGTLGIGYRVEIPMIVPIAGTLMFEAAFVLILTGRFCNNGSNSVIMAATDFHSPGELDHNPVLAPISALAVPVVGPGPEAISGLQTKS